MKEEPLPTLQCSSFPLFSQFEDKTVGFHVPFHNPFIQVTLLPPFLPYSLPLLLEHFNPQYLLPLLSDPLRSTNVLIP